MDRFRIAAGTLDDPTGLVLVQHIHTAWAGDHHRIDPDLPQAPGGADPGPIPVTAADDTGEKR